MSNWSDHGRSDDQGLYNNHDLCELRYSGLAPGQYSKVRSPTIKMPPPLSEKYSWEGGGGQNGGLTSASLSSAPVSFLKQYTSASRRVRSL